MISLLEHRADGDLLAALGSAGLAWATDSVFYARIFTQYVAYAGFRGAFDAPRFYRCTEGGILAVYDQSITLAGSAPHPDELWSFAQLCGARLVICEGRQGGILLLQGEAAAHGRRTQNQLGRHAILRYAGGGQAAAMPAWNNGPLEPLLYHPPRAEDVYELLQSSFDNMAGINFIDWYADVSLKRRRGLADLVGLCAGGVLIAVAGISYSSPQAAVIGSVATRQAYQGRGYASYLTSYLAEEIQKTGKQALIVSQNARVQQLYERLGFVRDGVYCELATPDVDTNHG